MNVKDRNMKIEQKKKDASEWKQKMRRSARKTWQKEYLFRFAFCLKQNPKKERKYHEKNY